LANNGRETDSVINAGNERSADEEQKRKRKKRDDEVYEELKSNVRIGLTAQEVEGASSPDSVSKKDI